MMAAEQEVRLYTKQPRGAVDVVAPEHAEIHAELEKWGAWNRERRQQGTCESIEKNFSETGGRVSRRPLIALPPNMRMAQIEQAVTYMLRDQALEQFGECLRMFYCKRWALKTICWSLAIQYEDLPRWTYTSRKAVLTVLG